MLCRLGRTGPWTPRNNFTIPMRGAEHIPYEQQAISIIQDMLQMTCDLGFRLLRSPVGRQNLMADGTGQ